MSKKIRWGILGTATIAMDQVIPAIIQSKYGRVLAIASRSGRKAEKAAAHFEVPIHYEAYQALLDDNEIDAVYIPLPNHLHVEWAIKALRAGKHVLVEKPAALNSHEAQQLLHESKKYPKLQLMEAYMYRFHPQWIKAKQLVKEGAIGNLKIIQASFSFFDSDPNSIVNKMEFGGGSLMDVGCYPVSISRFLFDAEPKRVMSSLEYHPEFEVDIHAAVTLEFAQGRASFFSSIQLYENQQVKLFGTEGSIEFETPFNPSVDKPTKIWLVKENGKEEIAFEPCNQYSLQADVFSRAILQNEDLPVLFEDAIGNMMVIDAIKESDRMGKAVDL